MSLTVNPIQPHPCIQRASDVIRFGNKQDDAPPDAASSTSSDEFKATEKKTEAKQPRKPRFVPVFLYKAHQTLLDAGHKHEHVKDKPCTHKHHNILMRAVGRVYTWFFELLSGFFKDIKQLAGEPPQKTE